jgi:hypothetical protein
MFQLTTTTENADSTISQTVDNLSLSPLELRLYKPVEVIVTPSACRRTGGVDLLIRGTEKTKITFRSMFAKICFTRAEYGINIANEAVINESEPSIYEYKVVCPAFEIKKEENEVDEEVIEGTETTEVVNNDENSPPTDGISETKEEATDQEDTLTLPPIDFVYVSALLDGITPVDESLSSKLSFFDTLKVVTAAVPKGGATPGNSIPVTVEGLVESDSCIVCLRGIEEGGEGVTCPATMQIESSTITFVVPDAAAIGTLTPEVKGKEKWYFIEVSIDGGISFDKSESAILNLK